MWMLIDQAAQTAGPELDAISVPTKREFRLCLAGCRAGVVAALNDAACFGVARQLLPLPASEYDEPLNAQGSIVILLDGIHLHFEYLERIGDGYLLTASMSS